MVIAEGWFSSFQCCKRSNKVTPDGNEGAEKRAVFSSQPLPIQTISENILSLENQHINIVKQDLERNYQMLLANNLFYNP